MRDVWVVNASPVITLAKAGHLALLTEMADEILLPEADNGIVKPGNTGGFACPWECGPLARFGSRRDACTPRQTSVKEHYIATQEAA